MNPRFYFSKSGDNRDYVHMNINNRDLVMRNYDTFKKSVSRTKLGETFNFRITLPNGKPNSLRIQYGNIKRMKEGAY